ncbi:MAG: glutamine amidotransferase family protein [Candidatus Latescibacterota bacterium]|nr:glutamine amidotransferase family protein [Candidatus Latescibacterota bacterium]
MCGIVGLYLKNLDLAPRLGELVAPMLVCMTDRGQDSAGLAIYGDEAPEGCMKMTLRHPLPDFDWDGLAVSLGRHFDEEVGLQVNGTYAIVSVRVDETRLRRQVADADPELRVMSVGRRIEILKEVGSPQSIVDRFGVSEMRGTHVLGHTRMATESAVTTDGSHPFSTGMDLCLVHNGSLSNHNRLRDRLTRCGIEIRTLNDSEVAAGYLMWRLQDGYSLEGALESALEDLDGFYTFAIGTQDGFAVLRDPIACKPAVLAETDDYVAMASEFQALAQLPGIESARAWEPKPATVYTWGQD